MKRITYLILLVFCCCSFTSFSKAENMEALQQLVASAQAEEKLKLLEQWYQQQDRNNPDPWIEALPYAAKVSKEILDNEKQQDWIIDLKLQLAQRLMLYGFRQKSTNILYKSKSSIDSILQINPKQEKLLLKWTITAITTTYLKREEKDSVGRYLQEAQALAQQLNIDVLSYELEKTRGWLELETENPDKALTHLERAKKLSQNLSLDDTQKQALLFLETKIKKALGNYSDAEINLQQLLKNLEKVDSFLAIQIQIEYGDFLCKNGKAKEAIQYLKDLKPKLTSMDIMLYWQKQIYAQADCLTSMGDFEAVKWVYEDYRHLFNDEAMRERKYLIAGWERKLELKEKKETLKNLELEQAMVSAQFRSRMGIAAVFFTLGLGILSFFLRRNQNKKKQLALELERNRQIAENRDRLFSTITHEIRTPLALMMAPLERAEGKTTNPQAIEDLQLAQRNGMRLMELFNQILDWNKAEAQALTVNPQQGQLKFIFQQFCHRYAQQAQEKEVIFEEPKDLPQGTFLLDFDKLDKIVSNLVGNAIKFCEPGEKVKLEVILKEKNKLQIAVIDEGPGISKEDQKNLFSRHYQGEQGKLKGGTGIGLALVKELIDLLKGHIKVDSLLGQGTTFTVHLPIQKVVNQQEEKIFEDTTPDTLYIQKDTQPLVLIVEDEPDLLHFLQSALKNKYQVKTANSTTVGLSIAQSVIPDMIISDWSLPDHDGGWLCRQLKSNELTAHIPILILTAFSSDENMKEVLESGAIGRMNKPFKLDVLYQQLQALEKHQLKAQQHWAEKSGFKWASSAKDEAIDPFWDRARKVISANYKEETYSVEQMASDLLINRVQLFRKLKAITGHSPSDLLRNHRLECAHVLLKLGNQSIADIAFEVGFSSQSYFSTAYKAQFGHSPTQDLTSS